MSINSDRIGAGSLSPAGGGSTSVINKITIGGGLGNSTHATVLNRGMGLQSRINGAQESAKGGRDDDSSSKADYIK